MFQPTTDMATIPPARHTNYRRLAEHYRVDTQAEEGSPASPPERFALAMTENDGPTSENSLTTARTFEDACRTAGEEILDSGRLPDAVYDLDTGERLELHIATPLVTLSEDQGMMVNPLALEGGARR